MSKNFLIFIFGGIIIFLVVLPPITAVTSFILINEVNNITEPTLDLEDVSPLEIEDKAEDFKKDFKYFLYFLIFEGIFHAFTGLTVLEGLQKIFELSLFITILEIGIVIMIAVAAWYFR